VRRPRPVTPKLECAAGFTLIEVLIVVLIIGILVAAIIPRLLVSSRDVKKKACAQNVAEINSQVERWYFEKGSWPKHDLRDIGAAPDYFPDGVPRCPVDGKKYRLHGPTHRVRGHDHHHH